MQVHLHTPDLASDSHHWKTLFKHGCASFFVYSLCVSWTGETQWSRGGCSTWSELKQRAHSHWKYKRNSVRLCCTKSKIIHQHVKWVFPLFLRWIQILDCDLHLHGMPCYSAPSLWLGLVVTVAYHVPGWLVNIAVIKAGVYVLGDLKVASPPHSSPSPLCSIWRHAPSLLSSVSPSPLSLLPTHLLP